MAPDEDILRPLAIAWCGIFGATIGSFLNVVIARLPAGLSVVRPRSRCPRCGAQIASYDNIPIVSWFVLRGRCRACRGPISFRYPAVEAALAAVAAGAYLRHGFGARGFGELAMVALVVALALIDLDTWLLPHRLTWPLILVGLLLAMVGRGPSSGLGSSALGAAIGLLGFGGISLLGEKVFHREVMGLGDAFLLAGIGAWMGAAALLPVVMLGSLQGSLFGIAQVLLGRGQPGPAAPVPPASDGGTEADADWIPPRHSVPFGPFLAAGALEWLYLSGWLAAHFSALQVFL